MPQAARRDQRGEEVEGDGRKVLVVFWASQTLGSAGPLFPKPIRTF